MKRLSSRQLQCGYLLEIPILVVVVVGVMSIIIPKLPPLGQKILICIATVHILFGLYYMIVIPGWMPGDKGRLKPPWNLLAFLLLAAVIVAGVVMFVLGQ